MQRNDKLIAFQAFAMYFLTGAACFLLGSSLPHLTKVYQMDISKVVLLGSSYAFGRASTVYVTGKLVEKIGQRKVLAIGILLVAAFFLGIAVVPSFYAGMVFAFLGGMGMGAQDTVCPLLLSFVYRKSYAGALSAGQALFGLGSFATPFLIGLMLKGDFPFYYAYFILLIVPVLMIILLFFTKMEKDVQEGEEEEHVKPLYVRQKILAYGAIAIVCITYCAIVNTIGLYTSSYAENIGLSSSTSAFMLTLYNVGCFIGSMVFVIILKKVKEEMVLLCNLLCSALAIMIAMFIDTPAAYFIGLTIAGFFLGVLFSVIIAIATRIGYEHISVAGAIIATVGGGSDILTPVITGKVVSVFGIRSSFIYAILMIALSFFAAVILKFNTTEEKM